MPVMSISGLASGLDTENIIKQLMDIERVPLTRLQTRQAETTVVKNIWTEIGNRISTLNSRLTDLKLSATFNSLTSTSGDEDVLTASATSSAQLGTYNINITDLATANVITSDAQSLSTELGYSGTFTLNLASDPASVATVDVAITDTLEDIRDNINTAATENDVDIQASIIGTKLVISGTNTGTGEDIQAADTSGTPLASLGVLDGVGAIKNTITGAQDANLTVNDIAVSSSSNTVTNALEGVTLNLQDAGSAKLTIARDTQKAEDAIQAFLDQYNTVMEYIGTQLGVDGELRGDLTLMSIQNSLRRMATRDATGVTGAYKNLLDLGIGTGEVSTELTFDRSGKLSIVDADKLADALSTDPDAIYELFYTSSDVGLAVEFADYITGLTRSVDGTIAIRKEGLDSLYEDLDEQIERLNDRLAAEEERLTAQFATLEKALSTLQAQGNWLTAQIASLQGLTASSNNK